jgi:hypothetical protein
MAEEDRSPGTEPPAAAAKRPREADTMLRENLASGRWVVREMLPDGNW